MRLLSSFLSCVVASPAKKTMLDIGPRFTNHTYFQNEDITVVSSSPMISPPETDACALILPGLDMSGLSVYPHVTALSQKKMRTYTFVSGDRETIGLEKMVRCVHEFVDDNLRGLDVTLIGESCGAIVAINSLKALRETRVTIKRLVLLNPATGFWDIPDPGKSTRNIVNTLDMLKHSPSLWDISRSIDGLMKRFPENKMIHSLPYIYMLYNEIVMANGGKEYRVSNWMESSRDVTMTCILDHMDNVETVLLLGENDGIIPQGRGVWVFRQHVRNLVVHWVDGGTHLLTPNLVDVSQWV